ncbi:recombinase family protein [Fredinandcohnia humi]
MLTCGIYARVSTDKQGDSIEHQVNLLKEFAKVRGENWVVRDEFIYEDEGVSATKSTIWKRPAMKRLLDDAESGNIQIVMFKGISRFARDVQESLDILDRLKSKGLRVISLEENYDSKNDDSNFMFTIHSAVAEYEAEKTAVRVRLGMKELAKKGNWTGGPAPDGYNVINKRLVVDDSRRHIVEKIFHMYIHEDKGGQIISRELNEQGLLRKDGSLWSPRDIHRIIKNRTYTGAIVFNKESYSYVRDYDSDEPGKKKRKVVANDEKDWVIVEGSHEAIIPKELWEKANRKIEKRKPNRRPPNAKHPLAGIIKCDKCGVNMITHSRHMPRCGTIKLYRYYECNTRRKYNTCDQHNVNADVMEELVYLNLKERLFDLRNDNEFWEQYETVDVDTARLKKRLVEVTKKLERVNKDSAEIYFQRDNFAEEQYNYIVQRLKEDGTRLREEKKQIEEELQTSENEKENTEELRQLIDEFFEKRNLLEDKQELRKTFLDFLEVVRLRGNDIEIVYKVDIISKLMKKVNSA